MKKKFIQNIELRDELCALFPVSTQHRQMEMEFDANILEKTEVGDVFMWFIKDRFSRLVHEKDLSFCSLTPVDKMFMIEKLEEGYIIYHLSYLEKRRIKKVMKRRYPVSKVLFRSGNYTKLYSLAEYQENEKEIHHEWLMDYGHYNHYYYPTEDYYDLYESELSYWADRRDSAALA